MSLLTAIAVAALFAIFGFPVRYYQCWFNWAPGGATLGIVGYLIIAGGGGGLIGWGAAWLSHAAPSPNVYLNGFLYGIAGALAIRADVNTKPKAVRTDTFADAKSILAPTVTWMANLIDGFAEKKASAYFRQLSDLDLVQACLDANAEIVSLPTSEMSARKKEEHQGRILPITEELAKGNLREKDRLDCRAKLTNFCTKLYIGLHMRRKTIDHTEAAAT